MSILNAHSTCHCDEPDRLSCGDYGQCQRCGRHRAWRRGPSPADRVLSKVRIGERMSPALKAEVEKLWAESRKETAHS